ncbi:MAG: ATP-binding protein [Syntrophobacteraceae bacterium]|jgi:PAS domain S-box-containing protein|nr:ATP-binding protein [Syntrophobacteraceae bacterium]
MPLRFSIRRKLVLAFLGLSLVPLMFLGFTTLESLRIIGEHAIESSTAQLEQRAREALELRAIDLAQRVSHFLHGCEVDLFTLRMMPRLAEVYRDFSAIHSRTVWTREGTNASPIEVHRELPLYREVAFIGPDGMERIRIVEGRIVETGDLRDVSRPENTTYKSEPYFSEVLRLADGEVYTSRVTGWYVSQQEQLQGARSPEEAVEGRKYEGVIRMATPCFGADGQFEGMIMLSIDHRHLMELTLHILPTEERFVVFPSYSSGNYAFMFDDEGWIISHPKYNNIRGVLPDGSFFDPAHPSYTRERLLSGHLPFNLDFVAFINPNYPLIAREVRAARSGVTSTFNVGGIPRVMAYAPIHYRRYPYDRHGVFGGITIGVETAKFSEPAVLTRGRIDEMVMHTKRSSLLILGVTAAVALLLAVALARRITRPILHLADKAREIGSGKHHGENIVVATGDELELLSVNFAEMAAEIRDHQASLGESMARLAESKEAMEQYSMDLEKQLRVLRNVHYLSHYLSTGYDRESVLHTVLKACVEGLGYDRVVLYLLDQAGGRLVCHKTFGLTPDQEQRALASSYDLARDDCIPTRVFRTGKSVFVQDIQKEPLATELDLRIASAGELESAVFTPLKSRDRVIGILGADTKTSRREISTLDVESLEIVANDAARAIELSGLYGRLVSERNFVRSIVTHMTSGIITLDEAGRVTWFNPYSEEVLGIRREDALGKAFREAFGDLPTISDLIDTHWSLPAGEVMSLEHTIHLPDGGEKILEVHFSTVYQEKQRQRIFMMFVRDMTQRRRMEEHIRRSDRLVSLGVLAAGIAHEMRNPLTGISLLMDDLHDHLSGLQRERELIEKSLQEIDRLENLITGLLDFAAPDRHAALRLKPVQDVVESTLFLVRKLCRNQRISLSVSAEPSLPPLLLDPEKLKQALLNLFLNAIQAMPDGGELAIELKRVDSNDSMLSHPSVRITVRDTGSGIADEDIPYIFDPFFSRHPSGCGLGLAIVHTIVEEHGGRVSVASRLSTGTSFRIDLPMVEDGTQA